MKKTLLFISLLILSVLSTQATRPKYVFYIIGDGMGINQVNGTEMFYGELTSKTGPLPLLFSKFPYTTFVSTYSANRGVTDSAAAGTALACGEKTNNNTIGVDADSLPIYSIAVAAQKKNIPVGIITSGEIDDATPAAFFAHQINRNNRYEIGVDMLAAGFDFYAGDKFTQPSPEGKKSLYDMIPKANYTLALGIQEYNRQSQVASKMILFPQKDFPYAIDRKPGDICLADLTRCAIDFLQQKGNGFFLMIEGSKIDWAGHSRDGATGNYSLNLQALQYQTLSGIAFTKEIENLRKQNTEISWETIQKALSHAFGFWSKLDLSPEQEAHLKKIYEETIHNHQGDLIKSLYENNEPIAEAAKTILNEIAEITWSCSSHTAGYVPLYAIGLGAENFQGKLDNTDVPLLIARIAGYE